MESTSGHRPQTRGVIVHASHGSAADAGQELENTIRYTRNPLNQASYNALVDLRDGTVVTCVADQNQSWHATYLNDETLGLAFAKGAPGGDANAVIVPGVAVLAAAFEINRWSQLFGFSRYEWDFHCDHEQGIRQGKVDPHPRGSAMLEDLRHRLIAAIG